jgi:hypothetical protein
MDPFFPKSAVAQLTDHLRDQIRIGTIGETMPVCFGVAQHEAWLKAAIIGATPDHERCVRMATRHLKETDPTHEAVTVIHAGLLFVAALKAGIDPDDAGYIVDHALRIFLPAEALVGEPATDY